MEVPPLLQQGDKEDAIGRVLAARYPSGALLGDNSVNHPAATEALQRYRSLVNQIHPERCVDQRAQSAFIRASQAYDTLCAMDSSPDNSPAMNEWEACRSQTTSIAACSGRWWAVSTVADLDRCLEFRSVVMDLLFKLVRDERDGFQHLERQIADAEKICAHLDRQCGIPRHRLWPSGSSAKRQEVQAEILRYLDLLCHLRSVHCFCQLRNRQFDHSVQLLAASPISDMSGVLREALEPKRGCNSALLPEGKEKAGSTDVDPLDEYMATIEMEARQALSEVGGDLAHPIANAKRADDIKRTFAGAVEPERQQDKPHSDVLQSVPGGHRTAEAASAEERVAESLAKAASAKAVAERSLQNQLLGDLLSDESELEAE